MSSCGIRRHGVCKEIVADTMIIYSASTVLSFPHFTSVNRTRIAWREQARNIPHPQTLQMTPKQVKIIQINFARYLTSQPPLQLGQT